MNGALTRNGGKRSIFSAHAEERGQQALARGLVWFGQLEAGLAVRLADAGWRVTQTQLDRHADAALARVAAEVAVADFGDGDDDRIARIEALIVTHHELQWLAVASERALSVPRVRELIHDRCFDFFIPPVRDFRLVGSLAHAWGKTRLLSHGGGSGELVDSDLGLLGASPVMREVRKRLCRLAGFDMPVLLTGETGTGKDVAARAIHAKSARRDGPFVAINCGALPENLVQSELFGHERGAFTGANARKIGRIEAAAGGMVFLDEIGDLPLEAQCNLLRFLEEHTIERVGSTRPVRVDTRVVAATHVDLERAVREGRFREDLYYRLNVLHVHLPPLRERGGDAEVLARHFLEQFQLLHRTRAGQFSAAACKAIAAYAWPGNVRELINRVHSTAVMVDKRLLGPADLGIGDTPVTAPSLQAARAQTDRATIVEQLRASGFNMSECARRLNISRVTLYRLCRKYRLKPSSALLPLVFAGLSPVTDPGGLAYGIAAFIDLASRATGLLIA